MLDINLDYIDRYTNRKLLQRFSAFYPIASVDAEAIFEATKTFLTLSVRYYRETSKRFKVTEHIHVIDVMWHTFIIFTEDYIDFCKNAFGEIYHHTPSYKKNDYMHLNDLKDQLMFAQRILGDEVVELWFLNWAKKYTAKSMHESYDYQGLLDEVEVPA